MPAANATLEQFIRSIPLFSLVENDELMDILRLLKPVPLAAGEVLFREGDPADAMWVLGTGAEVSISSSQGGARPVVVAYARAGETVGEMSLVDDGKRSGTATVVSGGQAHQIDASEFSILRTTWSSPAFKVLRRICMDLCARLRATSDRIVPPSGRPLSSPPRPLGVPASGEALDEFPPFRSMPAVVKLALASKLSLISLDGVTPIFAEGDPADAAYFILSGEITVGRNGRTLAALGPGSMFGMVATIDEGRRSASCISSGPVRLLRLEDADFDALFASRHRFAFQIVDLVARQLVSHLRSANALLPSPGQQPQRPTIAGPTAIQPVTEEEVLPELEILPLELEMAILDPEPISLGEMLK